MITTTVKLKLLTVTQAAALLGFSPGFIYKLAALGTPGVLRLGHAIRVDVDALLANLAKQGAAAPKRRRLG